MLRQAAERLDPESLVARIIAEPRRVADARGVEVFLIEPNR